MNKTKIIIKVIGAIISMFSVYGAYEMSLELQSLSPFYLIVPIVIGIGLIGSSN